MTPYLDRVAALNSGRVSLLPRARSLFEPRVSRPGRTSGSLADAASNPDWPRQQEPDHATPAEAATPGQLSPGVAARHTDAGSTTAGEPAEPGSVLGTMRALPYQPAGTSAGQGELGAPWRTLAPEPSPARAQTTATVPAPARASVHGDRRPAPGSARQGRRPAEPGTAPGRTVAATAAGMREPVPPGPVLPVSDPSQPIPSERGQGGTSAGTASDHGAAISRPAPRRLSTAGNESPAARPGHPRAPVDQSQGRLADPAAQVIRATAPVADGAAHGEMPTRQHPIGSSPGPGPEPCLATPAPGRRGNRPDPGQQVTPAEISLTIGRMEVRVPPAEAQPRAPSRAPARRPGSLDGYLQARSTGRIG